MFSSVRTRRKLWLIVRHEMRQKDVLTVEDGDGEEILPVFSFPEEAEMFVRLEEPGVGWSAVEATPGEVASALCGPYAVIGKVALDPPPAVCGDGVIRLVSLGREAFLDVLLGGEKGTPSRRVLHREDDVGLPA